MAFAFLARPMRIPLGTGSLLARTAADFEAHLAGRRSISPERADALGGLTDAALQREADALRRQEQQMIQALARDTGRPDGLDGLFAQFEEGAITEDHDWRAILVGLRGAGSAGRRFRRIALGHYLAYIGAARDLMRALIAGRSGVRAVARDAGDTITDLSPRQALAFDLATLAGEAPGEADGEFNRMPKGDTVEIEIRPHQSLDLLLARHPFTLVAGAPFLLVDEHGNDVKLRPGRNVIGRSAQSDVALDPVFRAISRRHVVIEIGGGNRVRLTDISTLGTFVPRAYLDSRLH